MADNHQADYILKIDKQQSIRSEKAIFCALNPEHGRLQITNDAMVLVCTIKGCGFAMMPHLVEGELV